MNYWSERWSWTQFTCMFLFAGFVTFLNVEDGLVAHLVKCLVVATVCGVLAGRFGDSAWRSIVRRM